MYCVFSFLLIFILSYLIGSINFSILISHVFLKTDIRNFGSKNAGSTNMLRIFGKKFALITFFFDFFKGWFSVFICSLFSKFSTCFNLELTQFLHKCKINFQLVAMLAVILGHVFPIFYEFKGGKGVATAAGAILAINFLIFIFTLCVFLICIFLTKMVSFSALISVVFFSVLNSIFWFFKLNLNYLNNNKFMFRIWILIFLKSTIISFIIILKHRSNIKRILKGKEPKIGR